MVFILVFLFLLILMLATIALCAGISIGIPVAILYGVGSVLNWNWTEPTTFQYICYILLGLWVTYVLIRYTIPSLIFSITYSIAGAYKFINEIDRM